MPEGLPIPGDTVRQTWGAGLRAGMYPISDTELYWFTVFNALEVQQLTSHNECTASSLSSICTWSSDFALVEKNVAVWLCVCC